MADEPEGERWRAWLDRHGAALVLLARQCTPTRADAEDAVQQGFLRFWQRRDKAEDAAAYLYACVRSAAMDMTRSARSRTERERQRARRPFDEMKFETPAIEQMERQAAVEAALNRLPADQREVVIMKIWGQLTFSQIGAALGVPLNTAASRYRYALERLQTELSEEVALD